MLFGYIPQIEIIEINIEEFDTHLLIFHRNYNLIGALWPISLLNHLLVQKGSKKIIDSSKDLLDKLNTHC